MITPISVTGEAPFTVNKRAFYIGASASGYTLKCSSDYIQGENPSNYHWEEYLDGVVAADTPATVECPANLWWMLYGNTSEVFVRF